MQQFSEATGEPGPAHPDLSDEVISPEIPPDPKDGFRLLVEGATEYAVFALSPTGVVCTWNRGAERINGYRPEEIVGTNFSVFYPQADREAGVPTRILETAVAEGRVATEGWRIRKDGSRFWASVVITALYDEAGRIRGFGKLTRDETERRETSARAVRHAEQERIAISLADTVVRQLFTMSLHADSAISPGASSTIWCRRPMMPSASFALRSSRSAPLRTGSDRDRGPDPADNQKRRGPGATVPSPGTTAGAAPPTESDGLLDATTLGGRCTASENCHRSRLT